MKAAISSILAVVVFFGLMWFIWEWGFCRFYVGPDQMAVVTAKTGRDLPPGEILAEPGQMGIQRDVLGEGRHFLNPWLYDHKIVPVTFIPPGKVGMVVSKVGAVLAEGEFMARPGQRGIWTGTLGPGKYRLNPLGFEIQVVDAVSVEIGYAGVVTSLSGKQAREGEFAGAGQKGVREDILQPGLYYINPREYKVDVLEIGVNLVSLLGKQGSVVLTKGNLVSQNAAIDELQRSTLSKQQERRKDYLASQARTQSDAQQPQQQMQQQAQPRVLESTSTFVLNQFVEFPSRDGFEISLDMTVEFEMLPKHIAWIFRSYGDLPATMDKIILPQVLSLARLKGSAYGARDFIMGEGRERFQTELTEALAKTLLERKINVHSVLIRHVGVPAQILDPIKEASVAVEQDTTNKERQNTAKKQAELNAEQSLVEQRRQQVQQETEKLKAETKADQEKQVAEIQADTVKKVALVEKETAGVRAEQTTRVGKAGAEVVRMVEGEKAMGAQLRIKALGDPTAYNLLALATNLSSKLTVSILHSGDGTLWTDLEKARLGDLGGGAAIQKK